MLSQYAAVSLVAAVKPARAIGAQLQSPLRASPDAWCAVASVPAGGCRRTSTAGGADDDTLTGRGCAVPVLQGERQGGRYGRSPAGEVGRKSPEFLFHRF